jgi:predicted CXXCH cytochrome family protein
MLADCSECHSGEVNIHPVGVKASIPIPPEFALAPDGRLMCRTCHRLHGGNPATDFLNVADSEESFDRGAFCARCHGKQMVRINPHHARQGMGRCTFCHASVPKGAERGAAATRIAIVKLCDFCHDALARNHPRNIDPTLSLPEGLPLGPDGSWTCATCHEPHGTMTTTHYIRTEFAQHFERGRQQNPHVSTYFACKGCHTSSSSDEIVPPTYKLRYRGDINILCVSCHVTDRGHHPTGLPPPLFMLDDIKASGKTIPLDKDDRIDCYTCHDNGCSTGNQRMRVRYYDRTKLESSLCWICHRRDEFSSVNPHKEDLKLCTHCHESRPIPGLSRGLMTVSKMVCLRCHDVKPHPASADHLREPSDKVNPDEILPLGSGGEVTCITCHDPHESAEGRPKRLRASASELCELCHWR